MSFSAHCQMAYHAQFELLGTSTYVMVRDVYTCIIMYQSSYTFSKEGFHSLHRWVYTPSRPYRSIGLARDSLLSTRSMILHPHLNPSSLQPWKATHLASHRRQNSQMPYAAITPQPPPQDTLRGAPALLSTSRTQNIRLGSAKGRAGAWLGAGRWVFGRWRLPGDWEIRVPFRIRILQVDWRLGRIIPALEAPRETYTRTVRS